MLGARIAQAFRMERIDLRSGTIAPRLRNEDYAGCAAAILGYMAASSIVLMRSRYRGMTCATFAGWHHDGHCEAVALSARSRVLRSIHECFASHLPAAGPRGEVSA